MSDPAQELLGASIDVLDKYLLLLQAARQQVSNTRDADARVRTRNLADTVATAVAALRCESQLVCLGLFSYSLMSPHSCAAV